MKNILKKAVLPVAGMGTRFLPASKAIPKEMLPILDKPIVQYAVEEAINAGIEEIIFITSPEKYSIEKHFLKNDEISKKLLNTNKEKYIEKLNPPIFDGIKFSYIDQTKQNGLGHAISLAKDAVGNQPFAVLLPDEIYLSKTSCMNQLLNIFQRTKSSVIAVKEINDKNIEKYGVIKPDQIKDKFTNILDIVEKPLMKNAPSKFAVCGRYIFVPEIFSHLSNTDFDINGEIQLTDGIRSLLKNEDVYACFYDGDKYDCGSKEGFVEATITFAIRENLINDKFKNILRDLD
tara:strand:+ start:219 stop:1088 length:870 start_codon:yes stop_codon:yes gene_type:complete